MSTTTGTNLFPHLWKNVLLTGVLSVILGIMMLAWPGPTLVVAAIFFGAYLLVTGISQIFHAFTLHISGGGRALLFISGAASIVLAVLAYRHIGDAFHLRQALHENGIGGVIDRAGQYGVRCQCENQNGCRGRIELAIRGQRRHVGRKVDDGGIDGGLDILRGALDVAVEIKLHGD